MFLTVIVISSFFLFCGDRSLNSELYIYYIVISYVYQQKT